VKFWEFHDKLGIAISNSGRRTCPLVADMDITPITHKRGMLAIAGLAEFFRNRIAECHAGSEPTDNLIGMLIEEAGKLREEELLANCIMMFTVGHSSTVNLIGISVLTLLRHPAQLRLLAEDPSLIETAISEVLRYDSHVQGVSRTALCDVELVNTKIHQGERLVCIIGAANRDPAQFPEPEKFDIRAGPIPTFLSVTASIRVSANTYPNWRRRFLWAHWYAVYPDCPWRRILWNGRTVFLGMV